MGESKKSKITFLPTHIKCTLFTLITCGLRLQLVIGNLYVYLAIALAVTVADMILLLGGSYTNICNKIVNKINELTQRTRTQIMLRIIYAILK